MSEERVHDIKKYTVDCAAELVRMFEESVAGYGGSPLHQADVEALTKRVAEYLEGRDFT